MSNLSKFISESSKILSFDRPDLWPTPEHAARSLSRWIIEIANGDKYELIGTGGWVITKHDLGGISEYNLMRHVVDYMVDSNSGDTDLFNWTTNSNLFSTVGVDIAD